MVEGEGMPRKNGGKGDLLIHFDIEFPKSMKDGEMKTLETVLRRGGSDGHGSEENGVSPETVACQRLSGREQHARVHVG